MIQGMREGWDERMREAIKPYSPFKKTNRNNRNNYYSGVMNTLNGLINSFKPGAFTRSAEIQEIENAIYQIREEARKQMIS